MHFGAAMFFTDYSMAPGDLVLIAGKGHERGQIIAGKTLPFDDADVARAVLAGGGGR